MTLLQDGRSILQLQLEHLSKFFSLHDVIVVVGFRKEMIMEQHPDLLYVYNPKFSQTNTSKSLLKALYKIEEDLIWLNGDVVFHPSVLNKIMQFHKTCMVVNKAVVAEEEVKYETASEKIIRVSKTVQSPEGEALGINFFQAEDLPKLKEGLEKCEDQDYFEKGIEYAIQAGVNVWPLKIGEGLCTEVDFPEDLLRANSFVLNWKNMVESF